MSAPTVGDCLAACNKEDECGGVSLTGVDNPDAAITYCGMFKGDSSAGSFKRSLIKTNVTRLAKGDD